MPNRFITVSLAVFISILLNGYTLNKYVSHFLSQSFNKPIKTEIPIDFISMPKAKKSFIDTRTPKNFEKVDSDLIAESSSKTDSVKKGDIKSAMPKADLKGLLPQARKQTNSVNTKESLQAINKELKKMVEEQKKALKKKEIENKVSVLKKEGIKKATEEDKDKKDKQKDENKKDTKTLKEEIKKEVDEIKNINTELMPPINQNSPDFDLFPLPMISIGENTYSDKGEDSFRAQGSGLGEYLKKLREKIGLNFHQMVLFHYKTNYIFESRTRVEFSIEKDGSLGELKTFFIEGDPLFPDYCKSVINSSAPFLVIPDSIDHYLEDDHTLKIKFMFGYNIKEPAGN